MDVKESNTSFYETVLRKEMKTKDAEIAQLRKRLGEYAMRGAESSDSYTMDYLQTQLEDREQAFNSLSNEMGRLLTEAENLLRENVALRSSSSNIDSSQLMSLDRMRISEIVGGAALKEAKAGWDSEREALMNELANARSIMARRSPSLPMGRQYSRADIDPLDSLPVTPKKSSLPRADPPLESPKDSVMALPMTQQVVGRPVAVASDVTTLSPKVVDSGVKGMPIGAHSALLQMALPLPESISRTEETVAVMYTKLAELLGLNEHILRERDSATSNVELVVTQLDEVLEGFLKRCSTTAESASSSEIRLLDRIRARADEYCSRFEEVQPDSLLSPEATITVLNAKITDLMKALSTSWQYGELCSFSVGRLVELHNDQRAARGLQTALASIRCHEKGSSCELCAESTRAAVEARKALSHEVEEVRVLKETVEALSAGSNEKCMELLQRIFTGLAVSAVSGETDAQLDHALSMVSKLSEQNQRLLAQLDAAKEEMKRKESESHQNGISQPSSETAIQCQILEKEVQDLRARNDEISKSLVDLNKFYVDQNVLYQQCIDELYLYKSGQRVAARDGSVSMAATRASDSGASTTHILALQNEKLIEEKRRMSSELAELQLLYSSHIKNCQSQVEPGSKFTTDATGALIAYSKGSTTRVRVASVGIQCDAIHDEDAEAVRAAALSETVSRLRDELSAKDGTVSGLRRELERLRSEFLTMTRIQKQAQDAAGLASTSGSSSSGFTKRFMSVRTTDPWIVKIAKPVADLFAKKSANATSLSPVAGSVRDRPDASHDDDTSRVSGIATLHRQIEDLRMENQRLTSEVARLARPVAVPAKPKLETRSRTGDTNLRQSSVKGIQTESSPRHLNLEDLAARIGSVAELEAELVALRHSLAVATEKNVRLVNEVERLQTKLESVTHELDTIKGGRSLNSSVISAGGSTNRQALEVDERRLESLAKQLETHLEQTQHKLAASEARRVSLELRNAQLELGLESLKRTRASMGTGKLGPTHESSRFNLRGTLNAKGSPAQGVEKAEFAKLVSNLDSVIANLKQENKQLTDDVSKMRQMTVSDPQPRDAVNRSEVEKLRSELSKMREASAADKDAIKEAERVLASVEQAEQKRLQVVRENARLKRELEAVSDESFWSELEGLQSRHRALLRALEDIRPRLRTEPEVSSLLDDALRRASTAT